MGKVKLERSQRIKPRAPAPCSRSNRRRQKNDPQLAKQTGTCEGLQTPPAQLLLRARLAGWALHSAWEQGDRESPGAWGLCWTGASHQLPEHLVLPAPSPPQQRKDNVYFFTGFPSFVIMGTWNLAFPGRPWISTCDWHSGGAAVWSVGVLPPAALLGNRWLQKPCSSAVKMWLQVLFSLRSYVCGHKELSEVD